MISELQRTQTILLTRLAALGAGGKLLPPVVTALANATTPTSISSVIPSVCPLSINNSDYLSEQPKPPPQPGPTSTATTNGEEEENVVVDVIHDSEDDNSSTTSGSDGGTTSTSHKNTNLENH